MESEGTTFNYGRLSIKLSPKNGISYKAVATIPGPKSHLSTAVLKKAPENPIYDEDSAQ